MGIVCNHPDGSPEKILVESSYHRIPKVAKMTLLHEMVHVHLYVLGRGRVEHGPVFDACMLTLAGKGAFRNLW